MTTTPSSFPLVQFEVVNRPLSEARQIYDQRVEDAAYIHGKHHHDFTPRACPFCEHGGSDELEKFHDSYGVVRCRRCAGLFVNPVPNLAALIDYYNNCACNLMLQDLYKRRSAGKTSPILDERVKLILSHVRSRIQESPEPVRVLEIGCGSGRFLANLRRVLDQEGLSQKVQLTGVDIDANAIALNEDEGIELHPVPIESFGTGRTFDIVLHFELIEHLGDPMSFMRTCHRLVTEDGLMLFTTPNAQGFEMVASGYNEFRLIAHGIFPPMHLNAFSTHNVSVFLLHAGFAVRSITTPGNLDADMVSLTKDLQQDPGFAAFAELGAAEKGLFQYLLKKLGCSSHMMVVAGK